MQIIWNDNKKSPNKCRTLKISILKCVLVNAEGCHDQRHLYTLMRNNAARYILVNCTSRWSKNNKSSHNNGGNWRDFAKQLGVNYKTANT